MSVDDFHKKKRLIAVVGLGYVGLPLAIELSRFFRVTGFDVEKKRVEELSRGVDRSGDVSRKRLRSAQASFTSDPLRIKDASIIIIAVPTPIDDFKIPDLSSLRSATEIVGMNLRKRAIVIYESTVYPGVTEDICIPILENNSGMRCGRDFYVGYSPERLNPGDSAHGLSDIVKVVSAQDRRTVDIIASIYGTIVKAGIHKAPDIRTAEAAKVIENIQRDLNIALVNELSIIFHRMGLDTRAVLDAAETKWNFLPFQPGLVGGHCIGVDPYYLTFKAQSIGYHPEVILSGRRINDNMGSYIADETVKQLIISGKSVKKSKVLILGLTFKEDIRDIRNTRVIDIYERLREFGILPAIHDPLADKAEVMKEYNLSLLGKPEDRKPYDGVILAVKHRAYHRYSLNYLKKLCRKTPVLVDVKACYDKTKAAGAGFRYWRL
jgi:UDP-N-acetyl-D-galactosamine dehydrogenase